MPKLATLKIQQERYEPILVNPEIQHFSRIIFSKNMFIFKAKEYQSEKSPIFDSQKSTKTTRKLHIMSQLYAAKVCQLFCNTRYNTMLLNSDPERKKLLHPKSIPTSQCYYCTLIFNNFEMFRMKIFELKPQTGGVNA